MRKLSQQLTLRCMMAAAVAVALVTLILRGISLPWSEEGALFALYGASLGFVLAILCSMGILWLLGRNRHR